MVMKKSRIGGNLFRNHAHLKGLISSKSLDRFLFKKLAYYFIQTQNQLHSLHC